MAAITNVLVIDRDQVVRDLLKEELEAGDYKVWAVADFEHALALANEVSFSIILADLKLPGIEGTEMVRKFKELRSETSIIAIVPYHSLKLAVEAMSKGDILDYVTKPFNIEEVKLVIRRVADRQYLLHQAGQKEFYQEMSVMDGLTGVYNRRHLDEMLRREIERAKRYNQTISLLMIDIDDFKKYNDTYGHLAGDEILKKLSDFFVHSLRSVDLVFRYGGEEFIVMLPQTFKQGGIEVAKRLLNLERQNIPITISIGVAAFPEDAQDKTDLLAKVDSALYQAKHLGKDRICLWGEGNS
jgi:diguanylate cyclase (GGDEF)-like protein